jgi:hypothetical protein
MHLSISAGVLVMPPANRSSQWISICTQEIFPDSFTASPSIMPCTYALLTTVYPPSAHSRRISGTLLPGRRKILSPCSPWGCAHPTYLFLVVMNLMSSLSTSSLHLMRSWIDAKPGWRSSNTFWTSLQILYTYFRFCVAFYATDKLFHRFRAMVVFNGQ